MEYYRMEGDVLWLGLHKTGTTFLQKSLDRSQEALSKAGIYYVTLDEFRQRWTRPLLHKEYSALPAPARLPDGCRYWLVFDENILALVQHGLTQSGFYPKAGERARIMAEGLGLRRPRIVLGVRSFLGLVPSLYCEALKSTPFKSFRSFLLQPPEAMSWLPLIDRLCAAFPESEILLYCAEDLPGHETRLLTAVTGLPEDVFTLLAAPERLGFSHEAVMRLHAMSIGGTVGRDDVRDAVRNFPRGPSRPGYSPWTVQERATLEAAYTRDLGSLRDRTCVIGARLRLIDLKVKN